MRRLVVAGPAASLVLVATALGCSARTTAATPGPPGAEPAAPPDFEPLDACARGCGPSELCGEGGNGLDDDCDGAVDEDCACRTGAARACFAGPPDRRGIGACTDGIEQCGEFDRYGGCRGSVGPSAEVCNGVDDDCNGATDDGLSGCVTRLACPAPEVIAPLTTHRLRGSRVWTGPARAWRWTLGCPGTVPPHLCPALLTPDASETDAYFAASGAYRARLEVTFDDGATEACTWTVYVRGGGLRVELAWDTMRDDQGGVDVDLHLHRWTSNDAETPWFGPDDCHFANCQPERYAMAWPDHAASELWRCEGAPHGGGDLWSTSHGACPSPRLDVDTNGTDGACDASETDPTLDSFCAPENINVDVPVLGRPYRIMVNDFQDHGYRGTTYSFVSVYCGGELRASFGGDLEHLPFGPEDGRSSGRSNASWAVADVVFFEGECGIDCAVYPVLERIAPITSFAAELEFGRPWSCVVHERAEGGDTCVPR